jgi:hypothetical protein
MLQNATLTLINRQTGATATGSLLFTADAAIAMRCFLDDVTSKQHWQLGTTIKDASKMLYIAKAEMTSSPPAIGDRVTLTLDGESATTMQVVLVKDEVLGMISHFELFLKPGVTG